jgi:beta-ketodecanoyl-[acyl-carrier-protein] synthase
MTSIVISGSGLYTPPFAVSNEALVAAFNQYVDLYNEENASAIDAGQCLPSSTRAASSSRRPPASRAAIW